MLPGRQLLRNLVRVGTPLEGCPLARALLESVRVASSLREIINRVEGVLKGLLGTALQI